MARKTFNEKMNFSGDLPKIEDVSADPKAVARYGGPRLLVAPPRWYNDVMARVPPGKVCTSDRIRSYFARENGADATCPLTAGIFINICAHASVERGQNQIPYWRTLKTGGELNEKYPDGIDGQRLRLQAEGFRIVQRGKRYFVEDFEQSLWDIAG